MTRPVTASSTMTSSSTKCPSIKSLRSAPSTAGSDQRTLVPSLGTSMQSSSRPSTFSNRAWKSESGNVSAYTPTANGTSRGHPFAGKPLISPFFFDSTSPPKIPSPSFRQYEEHSFAQHKAPAEPDFPCSSDPVAAVTDTMFSSAHNPSWPGLDPRARRPSTAPVFESQTFSQMLPPKRELPFTISRTASDTRKSLMGSGQASFETTDNVFGNSAAKFAGAAAQHKQRNEQSPSEVPRKIPAKRVNKAIRVTKNAAPATRSRNKSSMVEDDSRVPDVEEFLRRLTAQSANEARASSAPSVDPAATDFRDEVESEAQGEAFAMIERLEKQPAERLAVTAYHHSNIDTQALLARVDQRKRRPNTKRKDVTESDGALALPLSKRIASESRLNQEILPNPADRVQRPMMDVPEATTASMTLSNSKTRDIPTPPDRITMTSRRHDSQENNGIPPSAQIPPDETSSRSIDTGDSNPTERRPLANISNTVPSPIFVSRSIAALLNDPGFAKSPETAQWADLPPEEREAALETWMCQQLESESFATLTKTLEEMWQRIFFGQ